MCSTFRHKHLFLYHKYWDFDGDGSLTLHDFSLMAEKYAVWQRRGRFEQDVVDRWTRITHKWWADLKREADLNNDDEVDFEEWLKMFDRLSEDTHEHQELPEFLQNFLQLSFVLIDSTKDGLFCIRDYKNYLIRQEIDSSRANECFNIMLKPEDKKSMNKLTRDRFDELMYDFFISKDVESPGRYIFGPYDSYRIEELERKCKRVAEVA